MEFAEVSKVYLEVGILGLCAIFTIIISFLYLKEHLNRSNKNNDKQNEWYTSLLNTLIEQNKQNNEVITKELSDLAHSIVNGVTTHTLSSEENNSLSEIEGKMNECLKSVLVKSNASRVALVRFHNGGRDMNGLSFLKMSMTNEETALGVSPLMPEFQNMFRSFFSYWCEKLIKEGHCYIDDIETLKELDTTMYDYFRSRNVQAIYGIPITNNQNTVVGFIYIEFMDRTKVNKEQIKHCLHDKKIKIETLLNLTK